MKTVFLSSTAKDLAEYRDAVYKAIEGLDDLHCVRMEDFGARDAMADAFCQEKVAACDVFVGIVGQCYGSCPKGSEKSYTEQEYNAAIATDKPRLMFLAPEEFPLPAKLIETDEKRAKQRAFRDRVNAERIRDTFTSPEDLAGRVRQAIYNWVQEQATVEARPSSRSEGIIPLPPQPYFAHPYALQRNFTGRARERCELTEWFTADTHPMFAYVAIGGMGKSALTWAWLQRDVMGLPLPGVAEEERAERAGLVPEASRPEGVMWWSFYERESTFQKFLDEALTYASGGTVDPRAIPSIRERMQALYNLLCQRRFLLVLDGVERILRAYARMDAAYRGDEFEKDVQGDFRSCTDPNAGTFLQWLASAAMKSKVLMTSRLFPRELGGVAGCQRVDLTAFDPEDAVIFFHAQGVRGARAEIQGACRLYGYLPLALRLLSGLIVRDKKQPGDIRVASRYPILPELKGREQHHILEVAYNALDNRKRALLGRFAAFRSPMTYEALFVFNTYKSESKFDDVLDELIERGLLFFDRERGRYDLHPIVRGYAYDRLADKAGVHTRLRDYFAAVAAPEKVESLDDLAPTIELYHHTACAGCYDEAWRLFSERIHKPLYRVLGGYDLAVLLLKTIYQSAREEVGLSEKHKHGRYWGTLGTLYTVSGCPKEAIDCFLRSIDAGRQVGNSLGVGIHTTQLAYVQLDLGALAQAEDNFRQSVALFTSIGHEYSEFYARLGLAKLLLAQGHGRAHFAEMKRAWGIVERKRYLSQFAAIFSRFAVSELRYFHNIRSAIRTARRAKEWSEGAKYERTKIETYWILGTVLSENRDFNEAELQLREALVRCRRINLVEFEPDILLEMARLRWVQAREEEATSEESTRLREEALGLAHEALEIADRCEYRLKQADIHNFLAQVVLEQGDREDAAKHAETAEERALCDGPPHCYKPALDEAERLLSEISKHKNKED